MVVALIILIALTVALGFVFPVMFVAALAGGVLLVLSLVAAGRRAKITTEKTPEPN